MHCHLKTIRSIWSQIVSQLSGSLIIQFSRCCKSRDLSCTVQKYLKSAPKLAAWLETDLPEGLTVLSLPKAYQRQLRTLNPQERVSVNLNAAYARLIIAILMELDETWQTGNSFRIKA
jgi:transposase-like protein